MGLPCKKVLHPLPQGLPSVPTLPGNDRVDHRHQALPSDQNIQLFSVAAGLPGDRRLKNSDAEPPSSAAKASLFLCFHASFYPIYRIAPPLCLACRRTARARFSSMLGFIVLAPSKEEAFSCAVLFRLRLWGSGLRRGLHRSLPHRPGRDGRRHDHRLVIRALRGHPELSSSLERFLPALPVFPAFPAGWEASRASGSSCCPHPSGSERP